MIREFFCCAWLHYALFKGFVETKCLIKSQLGLLQKRKRMKQKHTVADHIRFYLALFRQKPVYPLLFTLGMSIGASAIISSFSDRDSITSFKNLQTLKKVATQERSEEMNQMRNIDEFYGKSDFVVVLHPLQREKLYTDVKKPNLDDLLIALEIKKEEKAKEV